MKFQILEMSDGRFRVRSKGILSRWFWHVHGGCCSTEGEAMQWVMSIIKNNTPEPEPTIKRIIEV